MIGRAESIARNPRMLTVAFLAMGILGAWAILSATQRGPGAGSDSAVYVAGAQSLALGEGLRWYMGGSESRPSNHPPLYSAALAPFEALGVGWETGARLLGAGLFLATIVGVGLAARQITGYPGLGLGAAFAILATPDLIVGYSWAMTEGLYLALSALIVLLGLKVLRLPSWPTVLAIALTTCLLYLTKFAGLSVVVAMALVIFSSPVLGRAARWRYLALFAVVVAVPFLLWGWASSISYGSALRPLQWNSIEAVQLRGGLEAVIAWILPGGRLPEDVNTVRTGTLLAVVSALVVLGIAVAGTAWLRVRRQGQERGEVQRGWIVPAALAGCYFAAHVFAVLLTLPQPDTSTRTLLPIYVPLVLLACWVFSLIWRSTGRLARGALVVLVLVFVLGRGMGSLSTIKSLGERGDGYAAWKDDEIITVLRSLPADVVYTDDEGPVFLLAGRFARSIPFKWGPGGGILRPTYLEELARMRENLESGALLVLFDAAPRMRELPPYEDLAEGLSEVYAGPRGRIYAWPDSDGRSEGSGG